MYNCGTHPRSKATIRYMVTISCQQKNDYISQVQLDDILTWLEQGIQSFTVIHHVYETSGAYHQLHCHALVKVDKSNSLSFIKKRFNQYSTDSNSYRIQWSPVYDYYGACAYLLKDQRYITQDQILLNNYYSINRFNEKYLD